MRTGFQQFLAACIGQTEEETDQPDDAQRDDESQTELEIATDDNSVDDTDPASWHGFRKRGKPKKTMHRPRQRKYLQRTMRLLPL